MEEMLKKRNDGDLQAPSDADGFGSNSGLGQSARFVQNTAKEGEQPLQ